MKQQKKMIYLGLSGATGRMGKAIQALVKQKNSGFCITANWSSSKTSNKTPKASLITGVIDFSAPDFFTQILKWCYQHNKAFVSGTTGLSRHQKTLLKKSANHIPIFYAENMSEGIWRIQQWIKNMLSYPLTHPLSIKIEDIHHKNKKDKPSGTALKLLNCFPKTKQKQIPIRSYRKAKEFGTHRVYFKTPDEIILLQHQALSRKLFARGALIAMRYLLSQKKGLYSWDNIYKPQP